MTATTSEQAQADTKPEVPEVSDQLTQWAHKNAAKMIQRMELQGHKETRTRSWPAVRHGLMQGFIAGVHSGFKIGADTVAMATGAGQDETPENQLELPLNQG